MKSLDSPSLQSRPMADRIDDLRTMLGLVANELQLEKPAVDRLEVLLRTQFGGGRIYVAKRKTEVRLMDPGQLPPVSKRQLRRLKKNR